jgi:hypothetical protein
MKLFGTLCIAVFVVAPATAGAKGIETLPEETRAAIAAVTPEPDRGTRTERIARCKADRQHVCYSKVQVKGPKNLPTNCLYGWNVGAQHPRPDGPPTPYLKVLNGLDQCAYFHDRSAWRWNPRTRVCERFMMCSNQVGLMRCVDAYRPRDANERAAKNCLKKSLMKLGKACVAPLYRRYGVAFGRNGWLTKKSVDDLKEAWTHCKPWPHEKAGF